jgi:hypothetical protein
MPLLDGMGLNWETRQYHYHKFFTISSTPFINIFGFSLINFRIFTLFFLGIFLFFVSKFLKSQQVYYHALAFPVFCIIFLSQAVFLEFGTIYRPETMVMTLVFVSFYLLVYSIQKNKSYPIYIASVLAGLSAFTHLNGLSAMFAGFVFLLFERKFVHAFGFGLVAGLTFCLYFFDITNPEVFKAFWHQFTTDPNLSSADFSIWTPFIKIANEHMRLFWNPSIAIFSVLLIFCLVFFFRSIKTEQKSLLVYFLALFVGLAGLSHGKTVKYAIIYFPYIALIITFVIFKIANQSKIKRTAFASLLGLYFLINFYFGFQYVSKFQNRIERARMLCSKIPVKKTNLFALEYFYFDEMKNFNIHSHLAFELKYEKYDIRQTTEKDFYDFAGEQNNQYIVIDKLLEVKATLDMLNFDSLNTGDLKYNYKVIEKAPDYAILELQK